MYKLMMTIIACVALSACGGGGGGAGGSSPSYIVPTISPQVSSITPASQSQVPQTNNPVPISTGSSPSPLTTVLIPTFSGNDPNAIVSSSTTSYDLTWGTPDKTGSIYASLFPNPSSAQPAPLSYMGLKVTDVNGNGPTLYQPAPDVLAAWNAGWTGSGVNVLMIDLFARISSCNNSGGNDCHAIRTSLITNEIAPGANLYGATNYVNLNNAYGMNGVTGKALQTPVNIQVVNMSVDASSWGDSGSGVNPTNTQWNTDLTDHAAGNATWVSVLNGTSSISNINQLSHALLVKSAGNDAIDAKYESTSYTLAHDASTANRLLIVGALNQNGSVANPASLAWYSNLAGTDPAVSSRFVLANGNVPYNTSQVMINGSIDNTSGIGTSYAAPIVAGYAAIIMQKFPNLDAVKTSNIILDTARYDTLTCYPNCPVAVYGQGEASLSRALAPVGYLR